MIPAKEIDDELWVKASDHHQAIKEALAQTQEPLIGCVNHDCDKCQAQRTWVGLTPEQAVDLYKATETDNRMVLIDAVEAKLKEKNA